VTAPLNVTVTGNPTPEELAAVLAVVASSGTVVEEPAEPVASRWQDRAALLRRPLPHGPGAWRAAG
jgi:hypothetical protein